MFVLCYLFLLIIFSISNLIMLICYLYSKKVVGILDFEMLVDFMYYTCKYLA